MARDDGLMTPTTSPPRLASDRTLTHVRATAGTQVMLSTRAPATGDPAAGEGVIPMDVPDAGAAVLAIVGSATLPSRSIGRLVTSPFFAASAPRGAPTSGAGPATFRPPAPADGAHCHTAPATVSASAAAAAPRAHATSIRRRGFTSPQLAHGRSTRCMKPHPRHARSATRMPRASCRSKACEQRGHWEAALSALAPQWAQRR